MTKPTKRKAFNFLRSYFDVLNELQNDKDRLSFLLSIINKSFLDQDPENLNFLVNLCYESQRHQIESSVNGWKRANRDTPITTIGTTPPTTLGTDPKEEKGEEKEKGELTQKEIFEIKKEKFIIWFNQQKELKTNKKGKVKVLSKTDDNNLKQLFKGYERSDFQIALDNMFKSEWAVNNGMCTPAHFLRIDNFNKYLAQGVKEPKKVIKNLYD